METKAAEWAKWLKTYGAETFSGKLTALPLEHIDFANRRELPGEHTDNRGAVIDSIRGSLSTGRPVPPVDVYLDPLGSGRYHVFDGNTRLTAHREHGAKTVIANLIPTEQVEDWWDQHYAKSEPPHHTDEDGTGGHVARKKGE